MNASSRYQEPAYFCDISIPSFVMSGVYQCFSQRIGVEFSEESVQVSPLLVVKAYLLLLNLLVLLHIWKFNFCTSFPTRCFLSLEYY